MSQTRRARVEDAPAIAAVHLASWRAAYAGIVPGAVLDRLSVEERGSGWAQRLSTSEAASATTVAVVDGLVQGFVHVRADREAPGEGEVQAIYVAPPAWGKGHGRALLVAGERDLVSAGFAVGSLWVLAENHLGRGFYEHLGWRPTGEERNLDFDGTPVPALRYTKPLGDRLVSRSGG